MARQQIQFCFLFQVKLQLNGWVGFRFFLLTSLFVFRGASADLPAVAEGEGWEARAERDILN